MDEQLIKTLMEVYAERGINLTEVIRDPMFQHLSLDSKIKLLKDHADAMLKGSTHSVTKADLVPAAKRAGLMAGLAAGFGTVGALKEFPIWGPNYKFPIKRVLGMGAIAGGASLALSALAEMDAAAARKKLYRDFEVATKSPEENAYLKLIVKNQGGRIMPKTLTNPIEDGIKALTNKANAFASKDAEIHGRYVAHKHNYMRNSHMDLDKDVELKDHFKDIIEEHKNQKTYKPNKED